MAQTAKTVTLVTPYATLSFPSLFQPKSIPGTDQEPKYSCALLFDAAAQQSPEYKKMQEAVVTVAKSKFGENVNFKGLRLPFTDAGEKSDKYKGYEDGIIVINVSSKQKPGIVDARKNDVLLPEQVYAGQLVRAQVVAYAYDKAGNRGVSFGLNHVQIVKHDAPRIDGRVDPQNAFDAIEDGEGEEIPFLLVPR